MKILVIAPTPFFSDRGTHIRILEESLALEKNGHKITIVTYPIGRNIENEVKTNIGVRRILRLLFWYKKLEAGPDWQKIILDLMLIRKALFLAYTQKTDIIHAHLHEGVLIGWIVQKILFWRKIKLVADFHGSLTREMISHDYLRGGWLKRVFEKIEFFINNLGEYALTSSWENTNEISKVRKDKKITTILDGVNLDYYEKLPNKDFLKKEFEFPDDKIIVVYAGALVKNKGTDYLMESMRKILKERSDIFFVIGGFPMEEMSEFVKNENIKENVRLVSPLNYFDLPKLLSACDIAIDPKNSETRQASGKILQYMAAGLPVVCFNRQNNREYLGEGGYFSSRISGDGIAEGILYFADNQNKAESAGCLNKKKAESFSWNKSAEEIVKIYETIIY